MPFVTAEAHFTLSRSRAPRKIGARPSDARHLSLSLFWRKVPIRRSVIEFSRTRLITLRYVVNHPTAYFLGRRGVVPLFVAERKSFVKGAFRFFSTLANATRQEEPWFASVARTNVKEASTKPERTGTCTVPRLVRYRCLLSTWGSGWQSLPSNQCQPDRQDGPPHTLRCAFGVTHADSLKERKFCPV